jgi:hypothetical protein
MEVVTAVLPVGEAWAFKVKWDGMRRVPALGDPDQPTRLHTTAGKAAAGRIPVAGGDPGAGGAASGDPRRRGGGLPR